MVAISDAEIERLTERGKKGARRGTEAAYKLSAAVIPGQEVSDRLMRSETHLSREIDRILNRLERSQRTREEQPLLPQVDVNIS